MPAPRESARTKWNGWGAPGKGINLADRPGMEAYLARRLGVYSSYPVGGLDLAEVVLPESRLSEGARRDLAAIVGAGNLLDDREARASHALGKSYEELQRARRGDVDSAPDAVLVPESARDVRELLAWASEHDAAVIPFGGGTSTVGGVEPRRASGQDLALTVDLQAMEAILALDLRAATARVEPGIRGPALEARLRAHGLRFGHDPQSFEFSTLGGWIATRSAGRSGDIGAKILAVSVETPAGTLDTGVPAPCAGPDLRALVIGSEGALGVITLAEIAVERRPEARAALAFLLPGLDAAVDAARELVEAGAPLAWIELFDDDATEAQLAFEPRGAALTDHLRRGLGRIALERRGVKRPTLVAAAVEGSARQVDSRGRDLARLLGAHGGHDLGERAARNVDRGYFEFPYLRDALMDAGLAVESFRAAAEWPALTRLHAEMKSALERACEESNVRAVVAGKLTRLTRKGGTLEVTIVAAPSGDDIGLVSACRRAAAEGLQGRGRLGYGGIGTAPESLVRERGTVALAALGALKGALDPAGVLNPGKLLPAGEP